MSELAQSCFTQVTPAFTWKYLYAITWFKWITWVLLSPTKRSYDSKSYGGWIVFSPCGMWKVCVACGKYGKISVICVLLTVRQAITSKVSLPSLSVIVMSHSFKNVVIWISKINLKLSWFIRMKYIPSYCTKRNSSMVSRISWNVLFVHWVVREKYILSSYFASRNSKTSPPAYVSIL